MVVQDVGSDTWFGTEAGEKGYQARMAIGESNFKVAKPGQWLIDVLMVKWDKALTPLIHGAGRCLKESHPKAKCTTWPLPESMGTRNVV